MSEKHICYAQMLMKLDGRLSAALDNRWTIGFLAAQRLEVISTSSVIILLGVDLQREERLGEVQGGVNCPDFGLSCTSRALFQD